MSVHGNRVFKVIFRVQIYHSFINYPGFITSLGSALGLSSIYLLRIKKNDWTCNKNYLHRNTKINLTTYSTTMINNSLLPQTYFKNNSLLLTNIAVLETPNFILSGDYIYIFFTNYYNYFLHNYLVF